MREKRFVSEHQREKLSLNVSRKLAGRMGGRTVVAPKTCSVDGCDRPRFMAGVNQCQKHFKEQLRKQKGAPYGKEFAIIPAAAKNKVAPLPSSKSVRVQCVTLPGLRGPGGTMTMEIGFDAMASVRNMKPLRDRDEKKERN